MRLAESTLSFAETLAFVSESGYLQATIFGALIELLDSSGGFQNPPHLHRGARQ